MLFYIVLFAYSFLFFFVSFLFSFKSPLIDEHTNIIHITMHIHISYFSSLIITCIIDVIVCLLSCFSFLSPFHLIPL
eukprot:UN10926